MFEKLKTAFKNEKTRSEFISLVILIIFITSSFFVGRASVVDDSQQLQQEREQLKQLQNAAARKPLPLPPMTRDSQL